MRALWTFDSEEALHSALRLVRDKYNDQYQLNTPKSKPVKY